MTANLSIGPGPAASVAGIIATAGGATRGVAAKQKCSGDSFQAVFEQTSSGPSDAESLPVSKSAKKDPKSQTSAAGQSDLAAFVPIFTAAVTASSLPLRLQSIPDANQDQSDGKAGADANSGASSQQPAEAPQVNVAANLLPVTSGVQATSLVPPPTQQKVEAPAQSTGTDEQCPPQAQSDVPQLVPHASQPATNMPRSARKTSERTLSTSQAVSDIPQPAAQESQTAPQAVLAVPPAPQPVLQTQQPAPQTENQQFTQRSQQAAPQLAQAAPQLAQTAQQSQQAVLQAPQPAPQASEPAQVAPHADSTTQPAEQNSAPDLAFALRLKPQATASAAASDDHPAPQGPVAAATSPAPVRPVATTPLPVASKAPDVESLSGTPASGTGKISVSDTGEPAQAQPSDAARGNHENSGGDSRRGANLASKPNPAQPAGKSGHADYAEATSSTDSAPATQVRAAETPITAVPHQATQTAAPEASTASKAAATPPAPVESASDAEAKPAAPQAQQISLRIPGNDNQNVEIRVMDRAGEVRVSVHTPDETLAHSMREELGSLTGKLSQSGFGTEAWMPSRPESSTFSNQRGTSDQPESNGGQRQGSQQGSSDQQSKRDDGRRPAWLEELENSQAQDQSNRSNIWPL